MYAGSLPLPHHCPSVSLDQYFECKAPFHKPMFIYYAIEDLMLDFRSNCNWATERVKIKLCCQMAIARRLLPLQPFKMPPHLLHLGFFTRGH